MILECKKRTGKGKESAKKIRAEKEVPGIIYGKKMDPVTISFKANEFDKFMRNNHGKPVMTINVEGDEKMVVIKEKQERLYKNQIMHVDFQEIHKGEVVHLTLPVHYVGAEEAEKSGGILVKNVQELEIACLVKDIPERISVDVSGLGIHDSLQIKDLNLSEDIRLYDDLDKTICSVTVPRAVAVDEAEEAAAEGEGTEEAAEVEEA